MNNYNIIISKLEQFIKKYYTNALLKGVILFLAIGLLYFLFTIFIEWALWLNQSARRILFWAFIIIELGLFIRFIMYPLSKLFKVSKGITHEEASTLIGQHFSEVNDKLLNILQLNQSTHKSELLLASIDQKAEELQLIQFKFAINFKDNVKYIKYLAIPIVIICSIFISGQSNLFSESYERVVNYQQAYEPPAPFQFFVVNNNLNAIEHEDFVLEVRTTGTVVPEETILNYNNETYYMRPISPGVFQYTFKQLQKPITFTLSANTVSSIPYTINITQVPTLLSYQMSLQYPNYTGIKDEIIQGTGNAIVPEGTTINWKITTQNTNKVSLIKTDTTFLFTQKSTSFNLTQKAKRSFKYNITTSNNNVSNYENLSYNLRVIKDEYPELVLKSERDSITENSIYFLGHVSDDYGIKSLELVYYPSAASTQKTILPIDISKTTYDDFIYAFPDTLSVLQGTPYNFYFQVFDNDGVNGSKRTTSKIFEYRKLTDDELNQQQFKDQKETINNINSSLNTLKDQKEQLETINKIQKEKAKLDFNDKKKLEEFLKRQQQQDKLMQQFNKQMKDNLKNFQNEDLRNDPIKKKLEERFQSNEDQLKDNEKLIEELQKLNEKISKEELTKNLEKLAKQNKNQERNLEQLLELTKRFYVEKKAIQISEKLDQLSKNQEQLSKDNTNSNTKEAQDTLNKAFKDIQEELDELKEDNEDLKQPMSIPQDTQTEDSIIKEQEQAKDKLKSQEASKENKDNQDNNQNKSQDQNPKKAAAQKHQKQASDQMKKMSKSLSSAMQQSGEQGLEEDVEMLRQILDNLITFSFEQEYLMDNFKAMELNAPSFANRLKRQSVLRENFKHIDDSLYALALRTPLIEENITSILTDISFNIDKSLERFADNFLPQGIANQQYTITGANQLAFLLSQSLDNMQSSLSGASGSGKPGKEGQGSGKGFQLPDIIKQQEQLTDALQKGMQKGKHQGEQGEGENGQQSGNTSEQDNSKNGESKNGKQGEQGQQNGSSNLNESMSGELFEIFKQQQDLRQQLETIIKEEGLSKDANALIKAMEDVENNLLEKGFDNDVLKQMSNLKHQLLKLEHAKVEQDEDSKRTSKSNSKTFSNNTSLTQDQIRKFFNTTEILNRQTLPLRQDYKQKVQEYFIDND